MKKRKGFFQKRCYNKLKEKRTWWRWDDIDRGVRPNRSSHNTFFATHAIWIFTRLSGGFNQAFFFFLKGDKKPLHHYKDIDHPIVVLRFSEPAQFLNTPNWGKLSFHHRRQYIESVALRPAPLWAAQLVKLNNSTSQTTVSSRPLFLFGFSSCTFLHPCSSINPTVHHLFSNHASSSFKESISFKNIARVHPRRPGDLANSFFSTVGLVPRPSHVGNAFQPCMAVTHVLIVEDESRGDSIFQFACFFFHVIELSFHKFLFVARLSFWSSTQTIESSRFSFTASSCPIFLFFAACWGRKVNIKRERERERKQKERKHEDIFQSFCEVLKFLCYFLAFIVHSFRKGMLLLKTFLFNKDEKMFLNFFFRESEKVFDFQEFFRASKIACAIESSPDHCRVRWRCWASEVCMRSVVPDLVRGTSVASSRLPFYSVLFFFWKTWDTIMRSWAEKRKNKTKQKQEKRTFCKKDGKGLFFSEQKWIKNKLSKIFNRISLSSLSKKVPTKDVWETFS